MSLHLPLLALRPDETVGDALERGGDPAPWDAVVAAVTPLLPDAEVDDDALVDDGASIELTREPLTVVLPYGVEDDAAADLLLRVVRAVEGASGLTAYDPMIGAPVLAGGAEGLDASVARAAEQGDDDGLGLTGILLQAAVRNVTGLG